MSVYTRRFGSDPGLEVLLEIESVNILDLDPPATISGVGSGTVICVGEYEDGPFATGGNAPGQANNTPIREAAGSNDLLSANGGFGYTYAGIVGSNPSARARKADSATTAEYWNGNAFIQLSGKKFARLLVARVDTSVGSVTFTKQAFLTGAAAFSYDLEPAQTLIVTDAGTDRTATFTATAGTVTSATATYNVAAGDTLTLGYDGAANFTVTFLSGDNNQTNALARINQFAGFTFVAPVAGNTHSLTGIRRGTSGQVRVVSGSAGVLTALGLTAATTAGTGNVANIDAVTFPEVKAVLEAAYTASSIKCVQDANGALRLERTYSTANDWILVKSTSTATALGFTAGVQTSNSGFAYLRSNTGTYPNSFVGGETLTLAYDDAPAFVVTFIAGDTTQASVIARINQYAGYAMARAINATVIELTGQANGGGVRVVATTGSAIANLGFVAGTAFTANALPANATIPAGTVVQTTDGTQKFVTMQSVKVTQASVAGAPSGVGPYSVKVRHALDDGSGTQATAGTLVALERSIGIGSFAVSNPAVVTAALNEAAIDAQYVAAIAATVDVNTVAREANGIWSARQSNAIRKALRSNVLAASSNGCFGRIAFIRPPLGTPKASALLAAEPGVGAYRDQRVIYNFPALNTFVPLVAKRGLSGGAGFTADGNLDVGADGFCASVCSQLPPEENPGQITAFTDAVNGLESASTAQGYVMDDYKLFRAKGICAPRMDDGTCVFQSGVTSVDPSVYPQLRNIARRRMADFIQDSLARRAKAYGKKLSTFTRRKAFSTEMKQFMETLLSRNNQNAQRIAGYTVDAKSGNTPDSLALGVYRVIINVRTLASLDAIVLQTTIGESVSVEEQLDNAA